MPPSERRKLALKSVEEEDTTKEEEGTKESESGSGDETFKLAPHGSDTEDVEGSEGEGEATEGKEGEGRASKPSAMEVTEVVLAGTPPTAEKSTSTTPT